MRSTLLTWWPGLSLGESCGVAAVCVMRGAGMVLRALAAATAAASSRSLITVTVDGRPSISFSAAHATTVQHLPSCLLYTSDAADE